MNETGISIPYGRGALALRVPKERLAGVLAPRRLDQAPPDQAKLIMDAMARPIGSPPLSELARGKRRVLVITSDHTRPVPSRLTLPALLAAIREGSPQAEIVILVATGMHRSTTSAELRDKLGERVTDHERVEIHDAADEGRMADYGFLPSGGALRLNDRLRWADLAVSDGFIEPHFFAGFSGGRKSVLPGVASRQTVLYNHNARFIAHPNARQGVLKGNPIHEDMLHAARVAGLAFILNVLIDSEKRVNAAFAGAPEAAHEAGCALCARLTGVPRVEADIVVTSNGGYPLDQNVYQSVKGMTAAEACVREGGVIVLCAALGDGHGGEAFYRWFQERPNADAVLRDIERVPPGETRMDQWEAQILARVLRRATVCFVTGEENRDLIERMHMTWAADLPSAMAFAERLAGEHARVAVIPDGVGVIVLDQ